MGTLMYFYLSLPSVVGEGGGAVRCGAKVVVVVYVIVGWLNPSSCRIIHLARSETVPP